MSHFNLEHCLTAMWDDYLQLNPQAQEIYQLFAQQNSTLLNDHIALRTFDLPSVDINKLSQPFIKAGYHSAGVYQFHVKKLFAQHFEHPDPQQPKIFISQLITEELSAEAQRIIQNCVEQIPENVLKSDQFSYSGRHWPISHATYLRLLQESEYAAWLYAFGFRPNHFTILINSLSSHQNIEEVNEYLLNKGFELNQAGGLIKGSPSEYLEQSSTLANLVPVHFAEAVQQIPGCYYEFAQRYPLPSGELYQGFVASSADKIFQSTDSR